MNPHLEGICLVLLAVFLEALGDILMDTFKVRFSRRTDKDKRSHH